MASYNSQVTNHIATVEYGKFVEIQDDARFPPISVIHTSPYSTIANPITALETYPKYAIVTYVANANEIVGGSSKNSQSWDIVQAEFNSAYVAFQSTPASVVNVVNNTGTTITLKNSSKSIGIPLPDKSSADIYVVANADEISLKRTDGSSQTVSAYGIVTLY